MSKAIRKGVNTWCSWYWTMIRWMTTATIVTADNIKKLNTSIVDGVTSFVFTRFTFEESSPRKISQQALTWKKNLQIPILPQTNNESKHTLCFIGAVHCCVSTNRGVYLAYQRPFRLNHDVQCKPLIWISRTWFTDQEADGTLLSNQWLCATAENSATDSRTDETERI